MPFKQRNPEGDFARLNELIEQYCSPEWRQLMRERNGVMEFRKGETIFSQGQVAEHMFMIEHGKAKVEVSFNKDASRIVRLAGDGDVLGHRGIGNSLVYSASGVALTEITVNYIPMGLFLSVLKANNLFCYHFLLFFAEELRRADHQLRDLRNMTVQQRVAKALKMNLDAFGTDPKDPRKLAFTLSRKDIANIADTTYESVIRTLAEFQRQGIIELYGKEIRLLRRKELLDAMVG
ncbi:MAG: Crp/Fnr family transcriptional regulator [Flavobacteriales bacterium]|nr:Crp/Fnr family transcriptional regulator [Flavobacteriales bacterium]